MRKTFEDLTGRSFGRLTALEYIGQRHNKSAWRCVCSCGNEKIVAKDKLKSGQTSSCGCFAKEWLKSNKPNCLSDNTELHGMSFTKEHNAWSAAKTRCLNPKYFAYQRYGGRGITMCERWVNSFTDFLQDIGYAPSPKHWLDRTDNDGNYEPGNVRWTTAKKQNQNRSTNVMVTINGETCCIAEWCERFGIHRGTVNTRMKRGMSAEMEITLPVDLSKSRTQSYRPQARCTEQQRPYR